MSATRSDVQTVRSELQAEIKAVRVEVREMRARLDLLEHRRLMTKAYVFGVVLAGILVAAVHYWPPAP